MYSQNVITNVFTKCDHKTAKNDRRTWVRNQIEQDGVEKNTAETTEEQNVSEAATLGGIVDVILFYVNSEQSVFTKCDHKCIHKM